MAPPIMPRPGLTDDLKRRVEMLEGGFVVLTPRNIWGQSFDGTADVDGDITVNGNADVSGDIAAGGDLDADGALTVGGQGSFGDQVNSPDFVLGVGSAAPLPGTSAPIEIQDEGSTLTAELSRLNFIGPGVVATHTGGNVDVTIAHTWASLVSKPTTIAGFGITDFNSLGDARWLQLTGGTLSGNFTISKATPSMLLTNTTTGKTWYWQVSGTTVSLVENAVNDWFSIAAGGAALFRSVVTVVGKVDAASYTINGIAGLSGWYAAQNAKGLIVQNSGGSNKVGITLDGGNVWRFGDGLPSVFAGTVTVDGQIVSRNSAGQTAASLVARGLSGVSEYPNALEWGHSNNSGYLSTLGYEVTSGQPYVAFYAEAGTTAATYRTRGNVGFVLRAVNGSRFSFEKIANSNADNQSVTNLGGLDINGDFWAIRNIWAQGTNGLALGAWSGVQRISWGTSYSNYFAFLNASNALAGVNALQFVAKNQYQLRRDDDGGASGFFIKYNNYLGSGADETTTMVGQVGGIYFCTGGSTSIKMSLSAGGSLVVAGGQPIFNSGDALYGFGVGSYFKYNGTNPSYFFNNHEGIVFTTHDNYGGVRIYGNAYPSVGDGAHVATFRVAGIQFSRDCTGTDFILA